MNDCPHFKSLVAVTKNEFICTKCGWIFKVIHHDGITVKELLGEKDRDRYIVIPDEVVKALHLKEGDRIDFELGSSTEIGNYAKVTKHDDGLEKIIEKYSKGKPFEYSDALRKAIEEWKKKNGKDTEDIK